MPDYYEVLGVDREATPEEISRAYHKRTIELIEEADLEVARKQYNLATEAWAHLSDSQSKSAHDRMLQEKAASQYRPEPDSPVQVHHPPKPPPRQLREHRPREIQPASAAPKRLPLLPDSEHKRRLMRLVSETLVWLAGLIAFLIVLSMYVPSLKNVLLVTNHSHGLVSSLAWVAPSIGLIAGFVLAGLLRLGFRLKYGKAFRHHPVLEGWIRDFWEDIFFLGASIGIILGWVIVRLWF